MLSSDFGDGALLPHDCHVHMALDGNDWKAALGRHAERPDEAHIRSVLERYADAGFAYIRDGGDHCDVGWTAHNIAREYGIEYASPVFAIYLAGSYGSFLGRSFGTQQEFETLVDEVAQRGGDFVKIMLTGIMDFGEYGRITGKAIDPAVVAMMVEYAHSRGFAVMAHVNGADAIRAAVEAGVDSVEHGYFSDLDSRIAIANSNTIWVPTFVPIVNMISPAASEGDASGAGSAGGAGGADGAHGAAEHGASDEVLRRIRDDQMQAVREVAEMGGLIALGSDAGSHAVHHVEAASQELACLKEAIGESWEGVLARGFDSLRSRFGSRIA